MKQIPENIYAENFVAKNNCLYDVRTNRQGSNERKLCNFVPWLVREVTMDDGVETITRIALTGVHENGRTLPVVEIRTEDLSSFYICGGFGSHMNIHSAEKTGLLPCGISKIATVLGNGALAGAVMMLLNGEYREKGSVMAQNAEHVSLSGDNSFFERYIENMFYIKKGM